MRFDVRPAASGGWLALAAGPRLLVLPELDDPAEALEALAGADGFRRAVDLLAARGLTAMPPFVLVDTSGEPRLIVRGEAAVTIEDAQGRREVDAASVSTWVEQVVPGLLAVEVVVPGAVDAVDRALPIREGVALAASLRAFVEAASASGADRAAGAVTGTATGASSSTTVEAGAAADVGSVTGTETETDTGTGTGTDAVSSSRSLPAWAQASPAAASAAASPAAVDDPADEVDEVDARADTDADADAGVADPAPADLPAPPTAADRIDAPPPVEVDPHATVLGPFDVGSAADPEPAAEAAPAEPAPTDDGYDYLFGETVFRSVAEAAVPEAGEEAADDPGAPKAGDHDGETVLTSDIAKLRGDRRRPAPETRTAEAAAPPPSVVLPNGTRERLDQPLILGRSPSASQVTAGSIPKLITLGSGDQDISRSHVRLALEGGTVVVTDLHSVNGTSVVLPGREPQRLRAGEPTAVIPGTVVDLGGGVALTVVED